MTQIIHCEISFISEKVEYFLSWSFSLSRFHGSLTIDEYTRFVCKFLNKRSLNVLYIFHREKKLIRRSFGLKVIFEVLRVVNFLKTVNELTFLTLESQVSFNCFARDCFFVDENRGWKTYVGLSPECRRKAAAAKRVFARNIMHFT